MDANLYVSRLASFLMQEASLKVFVALPRSKASCLPT